MRPYGDDLYNTGRETFLLPVEWKDGWPVILPARTAIPYVHAAPKLPATPAPLTSEAFTAAESFAGPELPKSWMTMRIPTSRWWSVKGGTLTLQARPDKIGGREQYVEYVLESIWKARARIAAGE